jgi:hypothetical protein
VVGGDRLAGARRVSRRHLGAAVGGGCAALLRPWCAGWRGSPLSAAPPGSSPSRARAGGVPAGRTRAAGGGARRVGDGGRRRPPRPPSSSTSLYRGPRRRSMSSYARSGGECGVARRGVPAAEGGRRRLVPASRAGCPGEHQCGASGAALNVMPHFADVLPGRSGT